MTTNTDATIYNVVQAQDGSVRAFRHYLPAVHWYGRPAAQVDGSGTSRADAYSVRIPDPDGYVPPRVWRELSDEERLACWTVQPDDLIVKGKADTEISDEDGHHLEELPKLYDEVCRVRFAHDNTGTNAPHIYAGGYLMAVPTVNAAPDTEITVKANGTTTKATIRWSKSMPRERTAQFQQAQAKLDSEVMRVMEPYMPLDTGMMIASMQSATHPGSGEIHVNTPYAAKVNYVSGIMGKNGPNRGRRFFDRMKADKLAYFKAFVAKVLGVKSK